MLWRAGKSSVETARWGTRSLVDEAARQLPLLLSPRRAASPFELEALALQREAATAAAAATVCLHRLATTLSPWRLQACPLPRAVSVPFPPAAAAAAAAAADARDVYWRLESGASSDGRQLLLLPDTWGHSRQQAARTDSRGGGGGGCAVADECASGGSSTIATATATATFSARALDASGSCADPATATANAGVGEGMGGERTSLESAREVLAINADRLQDVARTGTGTGTGTDTGAGEGAARVGLGPGPGAAGDGTAGTGERGDSGSWGDVDALDWLRGGGGDSSGLGSRVRQLAARSRRSDGMGGGGRGWGVVSPCVGVKGGGVNDNGEGGNGSGGYGGAVVFSAACKLAIGSLSSSGYVLVTRRSLVFKPVGRSVRSGDEDKPVAVAEDGRGQGQGQMKGQRVVAEVDAAAAAAAAAAVLDCAGVLRRRWPLRGLVGLFARRYRLATRAVEVFFEDGSSALLVFPPSTARSPSAAATAAGEQQQWVRHPGICAFVTALHSGVPLRPSVSRRLVVPSAGLSVYSSPVPPPATTTTARSGPSSSPSSSSSTSASSAASSPAASSSGAGTGGRVSPPPAGAQVRCLHPTVAWRARRISNFEYLATLNQLAGRSRHDITQYPVFPWVLRGFGGEHAVGGWGEAAAEPVEGTPGGGGGGGGDGVPDPAAATAAGPESEGGEGEEAVVATATAAVCDHLQLSPPLATTGYRDLSCPVGALARGRSDVVRASYAAGLEDGLPFPPFHHGSHYSSMGSVLYLLLRLPPFCDEAAVLQGGRFDYGDRLFHSLHGMWNTLMASASDNKEAVPELYYLPEMLLNINDLPLGGCQSGERVWDVLLPSSPDPGAAAATAAASVDGSGGEGRSGLTAHRFVQLHAEAIESDAVSERLHHWVDLVFGHAQRGAAAEASLNLFFHLCYEGAVDVEAVGDPVQRKGMEGQMALFGQTPPQLFSSPHPRRLSRRQALELLLPASHATASLASPLCTRRLLLPRPTAAPAPPGTAPLCASAFPSPASATSPTSSVPQLLIIFRPRPAPRPSSLLMLQFSPSRHPSVPYSPLSSASTSVSSSIDRPPSPPSSASAVSAAAAAWPRSPAAVSAAPDPAAAAAAVGRSPPPRPQLLLGAAAGGAASLWTYHPDAEAYGDAVAEAEDPTATSTAEEGGKAKGKVKVKVKVTRGGAVSRNADRRTGVLVQARGQGQGQTGSALPLRFTSLHHLQGWGRGGVAGGGVIGSERMWGMGEHSTTKKEEEESCEEGEGQVVSSCCSSCGEGAAWWYQQKLAIAAAAAAAASARARARARASSGTAPGLKRGGGLSEWCGGVGELAAAGGGAGAGGICRILWGGVVLTGGHWDGSFCAHHVQTGQLVQRVGYHRAPVTALALALPPISSDGALLAVTGGATGRGDAWVVSGAADGTVAVWPLPVAEPAFPQTVHSGGVVDVSGTGVAVEEGSSEFWWDSGVDEADLVLPAGVEQDAKGGGGGASTATPAPAPASAVAGPLPSAVLTGHSSAIVAAAASGQLGVAATAGADRRVLLHCLRSGRVVRDLSACLPATMRRSGCISAVAVVSSVCGSVLLLWHGPLQAVPPPSCAADVPPPSCTAVCTSVLVGASLSGSRLFLKDLGQQGVREIERKQQQNDEGMVGSNEDTRAARCRWSTLTLPSLMLASDQRHIVLVTHHWPAASSSGSSSSSSDRSGSVGARTHVDVWDTSVGDGGGAGGLVWRRRITVYPWEQQQPPHQGQKQEQEQEQEQRREQVQEPDPAVESWQPVVTCAALSLDERCVVLGRGDGRVEAYALHFGPLPPSAVAQQQVSSSSDGGTAIAGGNAGGGGGSDDGVCPAPDKSHNGLEPKQEPAAPSSPASSFSPSHLNGSAPTPPLHVPARVSPPSSRSMAQLSQIYWWRATVVREGQGGTTDDLLRELWGAVVDTPLLQRNVASPGQASELSDGGVAPSSSAPASVSMEFASSHPAWLWMGFQRAAPHSDFRSGGELALRCLLHLASVTGSVSKENRLTAAVRRHMLGGPGEASPASGSAMGYPVALAGVNLTLLLTRLLWEADGQLRPSSRRAWALFEHEAFFFCLYGHAFDVLDEEWEAGDMDAMKFGDVLDAVEARLSRLLASDCEKIMSALRASGNSPVEEE